MGLKISRFFPATDPYRSPPPEPPASPQPTQNYSLDRRSSCREGNSKDARIRDPILEQTLLLPPRKSPLWELGQKPVCSSSIISPQVLNKHYSPRPCPLQDGGLVRRETPSFGAEVSWWNSPGLCSLESLLSWPFLWHRAVPWSQSDADQCLPVRALLLSDLANDLSLRPQLPHWKSVCVCACRGRGDAYLARLY